MSFSMLSPRAPVGLRGAVSWILGTVDHAYSILVSLTGGKLGKFFHRGWGDYAIVDASMNKLLEKLKGNSYCPDEMNLAGDRIEWSNDEKPVSLLATGRVQLKKASFLSPVADILPDASKQANFYFVEPTESNEVENKQVVVIMLPATGEQGKAERLVMAKSLALEKGYSSVILTAPFYASRKPATQNRFFIDTVSGFLSQSLAIMQEGAALAYYFATVKDYKVCITGFSWGAAMTACSTAVALLIGTPGKQLSSVPYVGSSSPGALPDGVIRQSIDYKTLMESDNASLEETEAKLKKMFTDFHLRLLYAPIRQNIKPNNVGALRAIVTADDHFLTLPHAHEFASDLAQLGEPTQSSIRIQWLMGGHITALLVKSWVQKSLIIESIDNLEG